MESGIRHQDPAHHAGEGLDAQERVLTLYLKPRGARELVPWTVVDAAEEETSPAVGADTPLDEAEFVALDVETTGNPPFLVLEIGAERFRLSGPLSLFDTLVDCRAPINVFARKRHQIRHEMLVGAPGFSDARRAFLHFARGAALVEHSHDAFDTYLIGRGLRRPLSHPVVDTSALARLVLDLPQGQTPGLAWVVGALGVDATPDHAALSDAQATAAVFRELVTRSRERFGWTKLGDLLAVLKRPEIDRSALELPSHHRGARSGSSPRRRARSRPGRPSEPRA